MKIYLFQSQYEETYYDNIFCLHFNVFEYTLNNCLLLYTKYLINSSANRTENRIYKENINSWL
jgi:hypothetical protein